MATSSDKLALRVISAALLIPFGLTVIWFGGWVLFFAVLLTGAAMWFEAWMVTTGKKSLNPAWRIGLGLLISICLVFMVRPDLTLFALPILTLIAALVLYIGREDRPISLTLVFGLVAIALLSLMYIREYKGFFLTLGVMVCVWISDIAAYFAGRAFGGPKLSPVHSPNKTWSGALAAVICSGLIGAVCAGLLEASIMPWVIFTAFISLGAQFGDYLQSVWKRSYGVKDSSQLIPGHGGVLDRLDSFSAALILTAILLLTLPGFPREMLGLGMQ